MMYVYMYMRSSNPRVLTPNVPCPRLTHMRYTQTHTHIYTTYTHTHTHEHIRNIGVIESPVNPNALFDNLVNFFLYQVQRIAFSAARRAGCGFV